MMQDVIEIQEGKLTIDYNTARQKKCIAPIPKPPKQEVINRHITRMKKSKTINEKQSSTVN